MRLPDEIVVGSLVEVVDRGGRVRGTFAVVEATPMRVQVDDGPEGTPLSWFWRATGEQLPPRFHSDIIRYTPKGPPCKARPA